MPVLRPIELELIHDLTGMNSGYVLDFSNSRFREFFHAEVGIDIEDAAYSVEGASKGKRLRCFLKIGQPKAVEKALVALWEYREHKRVDRGETETVRNARERLSTIIERLGGPQLKNLVATSMSTREPSSRQVGPSSGVRAKLRDDFTAVHRLDPHPRGYAFERFLTDYFDAWGLDARGGFRTVGEQIDGSFSLDGVDYLVEAKWHSTPTDAPTLHAFQGKISERVLWARGLFISYPGFTDPCLQAFTAKSVILMDGADLMDALWRELPLGDVIRAKARHAVERKEPFAQTRTLFP